MKIFLVHRFVHALVVIVGVVFAVSLMVHIAPGDPVMLMVGDAPASSEQLIQIRRSLGLDRPLPIQLISDFVRLMRGQLGQSLHSQRPVIVELGRVIPLTAVLAASAMLIGVLIGVPTGIMAAIRRGMWVDFAATTVAVMGFSLPTFWTAIMFISLFSVRLGWFPAVGEGGLRSLVLPSLTLGWYAAGALSRLVRSGMLEVLRQEYVIVARAKGLAEGIVVLRHAFRNALLPVLTLASIQFGSLLSGAVVVETVFSRDGLGRLLVNGILQRDFPVVQGSVLVIAVVYTLTNLLTDLGYLILDPRLRYS